MAVRWRIPSQPNRPKGLLKRPTVISEVAGTGRGDIRALSLPEFVEDAFNRILPDIIQQEWGKFARARPLHIHWIMLCRNVYSFFNNRTETKHDHTYDNRLQNLDPAHWKKFRLYVTAAVRTILHFVSRYFY